MVREKQKPRNKYACIVFSPNALHGNFISSDINISPSVELLILKKKNKNKNKRKGQIHMFI